MKVLFLDGLGANPTGRKPTTLREHGYEVIYPILPDWDFDASVRLAQETFDAERPDVVIGYSRGGAVAMNIHTAETPLILLAPAWKTRGTARSVKPGTQILHSPEDVLVPFEASQELVQTSNLPATALQPIGEEHDLTDPAALRALVEAVQSLPRRDRP